MHDIHLHVHTIPSLNGRHPSILLLGYLPAAILHEHKHTILRKTLGSEHHHHKNGAQHYPCSTQIT
jgi:hypothetical protein